ncbi:MAG: tetratricopeptide repeat protein [Calditrichaeota bacterium]|nr:tetratricopeptide repeat protein [Calditrichota bacterium]
MKRMTFIPGIFIIMSFLVSTASAQLLSSSRLGLGFGMGGQRIYCDKPKTGVGGGLEGYAKYAISPRFFAIGSFGYGELSDGTLIFDKCTFSTDVLNLDLKAAVNLASGGNLIPYAYAGLGAIWFRHDPGKTPGFPGHYFGGYFDAAWMFGGGFEYRLSPRMALNTSVDYRFTSGDDLDGGYNGQWSKSNDGYLNFRTGLTFYREGSFFNRGKNIDVANKTPIEELASSQTGNMDAGQGNTDDLNKLLEGIDQYEEKSAADNSMSEYVQLKSKVDELNQSISQKELEIEELQSQLQYRKDRIAQMEGNMSTRSAAMSASLNADVSDFSATYEQAMKNFYAREFDAAINLFNSLLQTYPTHKLASNCQYWIGECYFGKKEFDSAVDAFEKVLAYQQSPKKDDALLMLGRSYLKMGDKQLASQMFDKLMNEFPDSEYFEKAQKYAHRL